VSYVRNDGDGLGIRFVMLGEFCNLRAKKIFTL